MPLSILIHGLPFDLDPPYAEGHVCSPADASALNQAWIDNIRTNFAKRVGAVLDDMESASTAELKSVLDPEFADYVANYSFKTSGPRQPLDPVQREAEKIARVQLLAHLNANGQREADFSTDKFTVMVKKLAAKPNLMAEAMRRLAALDSVASDIFPEPT